ncbi:hypothetical protein GOZ83_05305 [Agrobacterium vitis]|uniref:hypothetical protein n=1 Tax=Rhizobium/Agrobacterium group TaxID=227290 RepID=UPI0012E6F6B8|nr:MULTISPECIES: hypothetical protein [Rhizobium/Agrobacterium group]MCF1492507.1 hypothetical protein [Allorhizobium ampelinum]MVA44499.1 hypothetical protein [Agrobacterium vitis]
MREIPLKILGGDQISAMQADLSSLSGAERLAVTESRNAAYAAYVEKRGHPVDYRKQLVALLVNSAKQLSAIEVRAWGRVADLIEDAEGEAVLLEEAEFQTLLQAVQSARFIAASKNIREFLSDVEDAKSVTIAKAEV